MTKLDLGPIGVALSFGDWGSLFHAAPELEHAGYSTIWVSGGQIENLDRVVDLVRTTREVPIGAGIIAVDRFASDAVAAAYAEIETERPGRLIVGLGGAHGPNPLRTLNDYLDRLDEAESVSANRRMLAALGPRMLELSRERTAGALPMLATPEYTARARALLGDDSTLVVQQLVVVDTDPERARGAARGPLSFMAGMPAHAAHFRRLGFAEDEIARLDDRLVDAMVSWGDLGAIAERVAEQRVAGADQVALTVLSTDDPNTVPTGQWRRLAEMLC